MKDKLWQFHAFSWRWILCIFSWFDINYMPECHQSNLRIVVSIFYWIKHTHCRRCTMHNVAPEKKVGKGRLVYESNMHRCAIFRQFSRWMDNNSFAVILYTTFRIQFQYDSTTHRDCIHYEVRTDKRIAVELSLDFHLKLQQLELGQIGFEPPAPHTLHTGFVCNELFVLAIHVRKSIRIRCRQQCETRQFSCSLKWKCFSIAKSVRDRNKYQIEMQGKCARRLHKVDKPLDCFVDAKAFVDCDKFNMKHGTSERRNRMNWLR